MFRQFIVPTTATPTSIFQLLVNNGYCDSLGNMLVASVANGAIIPERVCMLDIRPGDNVAGTLLIKDNSGSASTTTALTNLSKRSSRNSICIRDYLLSNATVAETETAIIEIESI